MTRKNVLDWAGVLLVIAALTLLTIWVGNDGGDNPDPPIPLAASAQVCEGLPEACLTGLAYWNDPLPVPTTVEVIPDADDDYSGQAYSDGQACWVAIYESYAEEWEVYAHEFGHCKGLHHDEEGLVHRPDYSGIMDYATMWDRWNRTQSHDHEWEAEIR